MSGSSRRMDVVDAGIIERQLVEFASSWMISQGHGCRGKPLRGTRAAPNGTVVTYNGEIYN
jgi:hypothetical protein